MNTKENSTTVTIARPNLRTAVFTIQGTAPYVQHAFGQKAIQQIKETQEAGSTARGKKKRAPRDFKASYESAKHVSTKGWLGIPAASLRAAMISACRTVGWQMTKAKLSVFILADGYDKGDGTGLVKILHGKPSPVLHYARNDDGSVDLRNRPMWEPGWKAEVKIRHDADQLTTEDVANLLARAGLQVGIREGRPDSKNSGGMGWGLFEIVGKREEQ